MGTSPDVGGRFGLGRPQELNYHELETTAQVVMTKAEMGIVPNTLDVPFMQLGGNPWKYQASPSKPEIPVDVLTTVSYPEQAMSSKIEQEQYERLLKELPFKLGKDLDEENRKPLHERHEEFVVFEFILRYAARALAWINKVEVLTPEAFEDGTQKNRGFPFTAFEEWLHVV